MNDVGQTLDEQLSALMDGELPEAEARFLLRRLEHDQALRDKWSRLQLASSCLKGHEALPMGPGLVAAVRAALDEPQAATRRPRPALLRWGVAASMAVLAIALAPSLMTPTDSPGPAPVTASAAAPRLLPSPGSADLVEMRAPASAPVEPQIPTVVADEPSTDLIAASDPAGADASPLSLSGQSPADFPLVDTGDERSWPRSQVLGGGNDPALEAYLVRHNQMLAGNGLGGFVPYVDVVASEAGGAAPGVDPTAPADATGADPQ